MVDPPKMRRKDKGITDRAQIDRIVDEAMVMRLGLIDGDRPYVVPLNFGRDGDDIWFHSAKAGHKLECIRACPSVCVEFSRFVELKTGPSVCDDWTSVYESVIGFGTAEIVEDGPGKLRGLAAIMRKYSGRDDWEFPEDDVKKTVAVRIRLESVTGKRSPVPKA
jgi:nitroimidazol reductase NimA-like FMN-containing flavoprotein (pyridoxamine 5'-phosphate oxidase superfamily)